MRKVVIATPMLDGRCEGLYAFSLAETIRYGMQNGIWFQPMFRLGDALVQQVRNDLFADAYNSNATDMIWIDSDEGWEPAQAMRLLAHDVDVVGGTARRKTDEECYVVKCKPEHLVVDANGLIDVVGGALGTGFLRLSRKAIDYLWHTTEPYKASDGAERRWVFDVRPVDGAIRSEDTLMCGKLRQGGFKLYLDPTITCAHVGAKVYTGDFAAWMQWYLAELAKITAAEAA